MGIGERVVSLKELKESPNLVDKVDGVAEVFPEDKFTIVKNTPGGREGRGYDGGRGERLPRLEAGRRGDRRKQRY